MLHPRFAAVALFCAALSDVRLASQAGAPLRENQAYSSTTLAILVDVVVRDKHGRPVVDLGASDFALAEDGVAQTIDSFTRVSGGGGIGVAVAWKSPHTTVATSTVTQQAADAVAPAGEGATTAIVFDHLSSESLRLAQRAALDYIPMTGESSARVGVFATDPGIRIVQRYTTDRALVRQAVGRVLPSGTSAQEQNADRTEELLARRRELGRQTDPIVVGTGSNGGALAGGSFEIGERENERRLLQTELNMIRSFDTLDRDHRGYDTSLALLAVVRSLSEYPGRKAIVFFSEGLPVSPVLSARLEHVIDAANRANVTAYAVDASGLRATSTLANIRKEVDAFAEERFGQLATGTDRTEQPLTMAFERVEDTLKLDSRSGLARLAEDTGGLLFTGSNDLSSAFRRIDEDNRFHYLLTYSPKNTAFDGKFRTISVKVRRPGAHVFARRGYRAMSTVPRDEAVSHEASALALLDRTPLPRAFPVHGAGFAFPEPGRPGLVTVIVHVDTNALHFDVDRERSTYSGQAAIVVRIRDGVGREAQRVSQRYLLAGDAKDLDAARKGEILFYREMDLAPGVYTMETVVFDAAANRGSARVATLAVAEPDRSAPAMSSLLLVNRVERVNDVPRGAHNAGPLYIGDTLLYPNLGEPIRKSVTRELPFYFTLYGNVRSLEVHAQLLRNGQALIEAPLQLPPAMGARVQHVARLPIDRLPSGTYELRIRVSGGGREISRTAFFTLQD